MKGTPEGDISTTLNRLHAAASAADFDVYFSLFTQDAVFIGTDPKERWTLEQFKAYTKPYFSEGKGWTYLPKERHVTMSKHADLAWFDELLWNDKYRFCRGSGVVRKDSDGEWRVEQYVLSFAIANEVAKEATNIGK
ncbi:MAG: nuclear transport factor 2 family protein [Phycisphaerales bacterium]